MINLHKELIGQKINHLHIQDTFIKEVGRGNTKKIFAKCLCDCGKSFDVRINDILSNNTKSCGCSKRLALLNKTFGFLTVIGFTKNKYKKSNSYEIKCQCLCGNTRITTAYYLYYGFIKSCGCNSHPFIDISGEKFGDLYIINRAANENGKIFWNTRCIRCGTLKAINGSSIRRGNSQSCGCSGGNGVSKTETYFLDQLEKQFNISIERQHKIKDKYFDGFIKDKNLLIECDSDYWHSSEKAKQNDLYKTKLAEESNYQLTRFKINSTRDANKILQSLKDLSHE